MWVMGHDRLIEMEILTRMSILVSILGERVGVSVVVR
jgi:hypothetical protein